MKKFVLCVLLASIALVGCKDDSNDGPDPNLPIEGLVMPSGTFAPGDPVTIQGYGFERTDMIWFSQQQLSGDISVDVTSASDSSITFIVPNEAVDGDAVIFIEYDKKYRLGIIRISTPEPPALGEWNEILSSADNGWIMQYYPGIGQEYGGYTFVMKFNASSDSAGNVTIASQLADADMTETSNYNIFNASLDLGVNNKFFSMTERLGVGNIF